MSFKLGNLSADKGQKVSGFLDMPFTEDKLPVTLINGEQEGDTVLITGGIHNAEYVGIETVMGLARELEPMDIKGILIIVHIVNVNGFKARTISVSADDGKNLNRVFPGDPEGTYTDKLAYFMEKELFSRADYYIDVHNGDWFEDLSPFIYCVGNAAPEVAKKAEEMAQAADVPFYVKSQGASGGAYNYAGALGIPAVLLERGCLGMWTPEEAEASKKDVRNILRILGSLISNRFTGDMQKQIPRHMCHAHYIDSEKDGCWFPRKKSGDIVRAGEIVGVLKDYFGNVIEEIVLKEDCIILYQTISYSVPKNSPLIAYGHYNECVEDHDHDEVHHHEVDNCEHNHNTGDLEELREIEANNMYNASRDNSYGGFHDVRDQE